MDGYQLDDWLRKQLDISVFAHSSSYDFCVFLYNRFFPTDTLRCSKIIKRVIELVGLILISPLPSLRFLPNLYPDDEYTGQNAISQPEQWGSPEDHIILNLDGLTPLHYAALLPGANGVKICRLLLRASADPNRQASEDRSFATQTSDGVAKSNSDSIRTRESTTSVS